MSKGNVEFTCGATFQTTDAEGAPVGQKVLVYSSPALGHVRPVLHGKPAPCFEACPRYGSRCRQEKGTVTPAGDDGRVVLCQITRCVPVKE